MWWENVFVFLNLKIFECEIDKLYGFYLLYNTQKTKNISGRMTALTRCSDVFTLLDEWKEVERLRQSPVAVLNKYVLKKR